MAMRSSGVIEDVPGVQIRVHEPVLEDHLHQDPQAQPRDALGIDRASCGRPGSCVPSMKSMPAPARLHSSSTSAGKDHVGLVLAKFCAEAAVVGGLDGEVELREDGAAELVDGGHRRQDGRVRGSRPGCALPMRITARSKRAQLDHVGPPHLDRDQPAVGQARLVHLGHGRRGDGDGRQLGEQLARPGGRSPPRWCARPASKGKGPTSSCRCSSARHDVHRASGRGACS